MGAALAAYAALAILHTDLEGFVSGRFLASGGVSPLNALTEEVPLLTLELTPTARLRWAVEADSLELSYSPRLLQRFLFAGPEGAPTPELMGPLSYHEGLLVLAHRFSRGTQLQLQGGGGYGVTTYNDTLTLAGTPGAGTGGNTANTAVDNLEVANAFGRLALSSVVLPRGDRLEIATDVSTSLAFAQDSMVSQRDRLRLSTVAGYTFAPTRVDGVVLGLVQETSFFLDDVAPLPGTPDADGSSVLGLNLGWSRRLTRTARGAVRLGVVMLFNQEVQVAPSANAELELVIIQAPGVRASTSFRGGLEGRTSAIVAASELHATAAWETRFVFPPDKGLVVSIDFDAPIPNDDSTVVLPAVLVLSAPFSWQIEPGIDFQLGGRVGLRGVIHPGEGIAMLNGVQAAEFGDTLDAQIFTGISIELSTAGQSRYVR